MFRIEILVPNVAPCFDMDLFCRSQSTPELNVTWSSIERGPASVESSCDQALAAPELIRLAMKAEEEGADAVIVDCMGDPGLPAIRECVGIPAFGPAQTAMHVAATLGRRFTVVSILRRRRARIRELAYTYGVDRAMAPVRSVNIPVLEIEANPDSLAQRLLEESKQAVLEDESDVIVLGCTGFDGVAQRLQRDLAANNIGDVLVIEPLPVTVGYGCAMLKLGISHSKRAYPYPPKKRITGFAPWDPEV